MVNKYLIVTLCFLLGIGELASQNFPWNHWDYYTYGGDVEELVIDGSSIWAATQGGLVQVDRASLTFEVCHRGNSFLPSHQVRHLTRDKQGVVYASTYNRIVEVEGKEMRLLKDELEGIPASGLFQGLRIAGKNGIWKKTDDSWEKEIELPESAAWYILSDFVIDPFNEDFWLTAWTFGSFRVFHFDGAEWEWFDYANSDLPFESPGNNKLQFDQRGDLWAATQAGLYTFDGNEWNQAFISPDLGPSFGCSAIHLDDEKRLWVACFSGWNTPARLFVKEQNQWIEYPLQDSVRWINDIKVSQNEIWLATQGQGIYLHKEGEAWQRIFPSNSLLSSNWITSLDWDPVEKKMWVGTQGTSSVGGKLYAVKNGKLIPEAFAPMSYPRQVVRQPNGPLWALVSEGLFVNNGEFWLPFNPGTGRIQPEYIERISFDYQGKLWMIHDNELIIREGNSQYTYLSRSDVKQTAAMYILFNHPKSSEAWVSSYAEFSHFNGGRWNSSQEIFGEKVIMYDALADADGVVWLATDKGLLRYENLQYEWIKEPDGEELSFRSIALRPDGKLWLSSRDRIWRYEPGSNWPWDGWGENYAPLAGRAEMLEVDDTGNLWLAADGLGVWGDDILSWAVSHEIGTGQDLAQGESLIYPNPVGPNAALNILLQGVEFDYLRLVDIQGKAVLNQFMDQPTTFFKLGLKRSGPDRTYYNTASGIYLLSVFKGEKLLLTEKILIAGDR